MQLQAQTESRPSFPLRFSLWLDPSPETAATEHETQPARPQSNTLHPTSISIPSTEITTASAVVGGASQRFEDWSLLLLLSSPGISINKFTSSPPAHLHLPPTQVHRSFLKTSLSLPTADLFLATFFKHTLYSCRSPAPARFPSKTSGVHNETIQAYSRPRLSRQLSSLSEEINQ